MADIVYEYIFRGVPQFQDVQNELLEIITLNEKLKLQDTQNRQAAKEAAAARKQAAEEAKQAVISQINAELGIKKGLEDQIGIIEQLRQRIKILKSERESANNVESILTYNKALQASQTELNKLTGVTDKFRGSNGFWQDLKGQIFAALAVGQVVEWGKALVTNEAYLESQRLALRNVIKSQEDYANSLAFLNNLSNKYGQDITVLTQSYKSFVAASEESGLSLKERNRIYESIVKSGAALNLTNDQIQGSLNAVAQMFSKGNVQAEELRGQLGERLPGAFGLAAKALGVTESKLNDMLKQGQVLAKDLLPLLATELEKTYGSKAANNVNTLAGASNRYFNAVKEYFGEINKNYGITQKFVASFNFLADNLGEVVNVLGTVLTTLGLYIASTKAAGVASAAWTAIEKIGLIVRGEAILATEALTGATIVQTESQIAATTAAKAFNSALLSNPIGLAVLAIGTLVTAYQLYNAAQEDATEAQEKLNKQISDAIAPLELQKREFNLLANEVLKGVVPLQQQYETLEALKKQYPDLLKGISNLTEAEKVLNENKIKVNAQDDYRLGKLELLKQKYPEQLAGINNLKDAEQKLSGILKEVNADFAVRALLLEADIKYNINKEKATNLIKDQITAEQQLGNVRKSLAVELKNNLEGREDLIAALKEEQKQLEGTIRAQKNGVVNLIGVNQSLTKLQDDQRKKLKYNYDEEVKIVKDGEGKKSKEKIDSAKTLALIQEKSDNDAYEKTRATEQKTLSLQRDIDVQRIKDSKASADKKAAQILKVEEEYFAKSSQLTNKYDTQEDKEQDKLRKQRLDFQKSFDDNVIKSKESQADRSVKIAGKEKKELDALDRKAAKDSNELQVQKNELAEKLRVLDLIANAKTAKEVTTIQRTEQEKQLRDLKEHYALNLQLANIRLSQIKEQYGEESEEYKKQRNVVIGYEQSFVVVSISLIDFLTEKQKQAYKTRAQDAQEALGFILDATEAFGSLLEKTIDDSMTDTSNLVQQENAKIAKETLNSFKNIISGIGRLASGDIVGGAISLIGGLVEGINSLGNSAERLAEARMQQSIALLNEYLTEVRSDIDEIVSYFDKIKEVYNLANDAKLPDYGANSAKEAIENEIKRGEAIQENYNKAVDAENRLHETTIANINDKYGKLEANEDTYHNTQVQNIDDAYAKDVNKEKERHDTAIKNINDQYDLEVAKINAKYDLISTKAEQQYNKETLAITSAGTAQLEALIKNEQSLNSVREEFAAKRQYINETFALANKQLTAESSQAEIDAVNAAIKARDSALAELQSQYNDELVLIANAEGQKRKEYSATELIQKTIRENLDKAALKFEADEIQRTKDRTEEIVKAEKDKNTALLAETAIYNTNLVALEVTKNKDLLDESIRHNTAIFDIEAKRRVDTEQAVALHNDTLQKLAIDKDTAIAESAVRLTTLLQIQALLIEQALANSAAKGTEAYQALEAELQRVKALLEQITGGTYTPFNPFPAFPPGEIPVPPIIPPFDPITVPRIAKGVDRLPNYSGVIGIDTQPAMLNTGERVMTTEMNDGLKQFFGKDMTNKQLFNYIVNPNYEYISNIGKVKPSGNKDVVDALNGVKKEFGKLEQVKIIMNNGVPDIEKRSSDRMIKRIRL